MLHRILTPLKTNSYFVFGARGTGKSTLLKSIFTPEQALYINLLDPAEEDLFHRDPNELIHRTATLPPGMKWIVIDEVQRAPRLLRRASELKSALGLK